MTEEALPLVAYILPLQICVVLLDEHAPMLPSAAKAAFTTLAVYVFHHAHLASVLCVSAVQLCASLVNVFYEARNARASSYKLCATLHDAQFAIVAVAYCFWVYDNFLLEK